MNSAYINVFIVTYFAMFSDFAATYSPNILSICENIFSNIQLYPNRCILDYGLVSNVCYSIRTTFLAMHQLLSNELLLPLIVGFM
jgi:hypothetical protein